MDLHRIADELEALQEQLGRILNIIQDSMDEGHNGKLNQGMAIGMHTARAIVAQRITELRMAANSSLQARLPYMEDVR